MCKTMGNILFFCLVFLVHQTTSTEVIYKLSQDDYARMPPKILLDHYTHCLFQRDGVYCTADADIVSDGPSELLDKMRGYSAFTIAHYNHTQLSYGLCMKQTCREFYNGSSKPELQLAAEACLNNTLFRSHGLKTRVTKVNCYFEDQSKNKYTVDWVDWAVAAFMFTIVALNVIGSVYDFSRDQTKPGNRYLLTFSCRRNWKQLMAPPSSDPRAMELQSLNGIRFLSCLYIVLMHAGIPSVIALANMDFIEKGYDTAQLYTTYNGNLFTQSFFLMSGFLLAYNMQISTEKEPLTWKKYFKSIFFRYMRLARLIFVSVMLTATWLRFTDYGPLWQQQVGGEVDDCRNYWLYNVLFVNNFVDVSTCNLQAWSSAADFHLHIVGLTVIFLAPNARWRRRALGTIFIVGLLWPAYKVFSMDLDGTLLIRPETSTKFFQNDKTFHYLYKRTYGNIPVFIIGMTFGYIVYDMQKKKITSQDHTKYRYVYWLLAPLVYLPLLAGGYCFYREGPRASLLLRVLFTPVVKPLFGLTVMLLIFGAVNKVETVYRSVLEWRGFVPLAKLSYSIYTFHVTVERYLAGTRSTLVHLSIPHALHEFCGIILLSMLVSLVMYLAVEAPILKLVNMAFAKPRPVQPAVAEKDAKTE